MGAYGIYVWSSVGITLGSMALYLAYVYYSVIRHRRASGNAHTKGL